MLAFWLLIFYYYDCSLFKPLCNLRSALCLRALSSDFVQAENRKVSRCSLPPEDPNGYVTIGERG